MALNLAFCVDSLVNAGIFTGHAAWPPSKLRMSLPPPRRGEPLPLCACGHCCLLSCEGSTSESGAHVHRCVPTGVSSHVCAHRYVPTGVSLQICPHRCAPTRCVLIGVCPQMCPHRCAPHRCVLTGVCPQVCAHRCVLIGVCSQMCPHRCVSHRCVLTGVCLQVCAHRCVPAQMYVHRCVLMAGGPSTGTSQPSWDLCMERASWVPWHLLTLPQFAKSVPSCGHWGHIQAFNWIPAKASQLPSCRAAGVPVGSEGEEGHSGAAR